MGPRELPAQVVDRIGDDGKRKRGARLLAALADPKSSSSQIAKRGWLRRRLETFLNILPQAIHGWTTEAEQLHWEIRRGETWHFSLFRSVLLQHRVEIRAPETE